MGRRRRRAARARPRSAPGAPRRAARDRSQLPSGRFAGPMQTIAGRIMLLGALFVLALCAATSSAQASSGIQYGIQDDTWLEFGPGKFDQRVETFKRLGVPLVRFTLRWNEVALRRPKNAASPTRSRLRLASAGQGPARPSAPRADGRAHGRRDSGVGERRAPGELRSAARSRLPPLRDSRRPPLPLGSLLADLERAEQAALAQADEAGDLRPAPAQPRV